MDLAIRGGTVVSEDGRAEIDLGVVGGSFSHVGGQVPVARVEIDASGLLVMPGGIDMHVHLSPSPNRAVNWVDDFAIGSRAAAAGGITTIGNMTSPGSGEDLDHAVGRIAAEAEADSIVDFVLHPVVRDPVHQLGAIRELAAGGIASVKLFMLMSDFEAKLPAVLALMETAAELGLIVMLHCEDASINAFATERLFRAGRGGVSHYAASRPRSGEVAAVARALALTEITGAQTYLVHVASEGAVDLIRRARDAGLSIQAETRPVYLHLTDEVLARPDGALYVGSPPIGSQRDRDALWEGLRQGIISTVASDHAPWMRADKLDPSLNVRSLPPGLPELETSLPMLFSEGVRAGQLTAERFVAVTSTIPARIFGLHPRKGAILPGSDADLAIWDPNAEWTVRAKDGHSRSDYSPYEGWPVIGRPVHTIRRGEVIWSQGSHPAPVGRGRLQRRTEAADVRP
jgi:dihydropyrimidinase